MLSFSVIAFLEPWSPVGCRESLPVVLLCFTFCSSPSEAYPSDVMSLGLPSDAARASWSVLLSLSSEAYPSEALSIGLLEHWSPGALVSRRTPREPPGQASALYFPPILPYVGPISGGLREGMALYLQGVVPTNADKFTINVKTGQSVDDDIAFHFNPQMGSKVVMNSFRNKKWGAEESFSEMSFKKGQAFEMFIVIKSEGYQVYVNGKEQYTFKHRIPLEKVSALNIIGDVAVNLSGFIQNWSTSSFVTKVKSTITSLGRSRGERSIVQSEVLQPVQNPTLPYVGQIPEGMREGMALYVQGVVPTNSKRFSINFKTGPTDKDGIAFHFNPRMGSNVILNSFTNGKWGTEQIVSDNPFKNGEDFEMFIIIKSEGYQVQIKGQQHSMYKHRVPLEKVNTVNINGTVSISYLGFVMGM
ncbi:galectin-6 [Chanodichthys erythropterus]|uniref:galectin-6 n=1 Tax=Chanodichthys erythropterus TaxID=933992 RepID=UPI00351F6CB3